MRYALELVRTTPAQEQEAPDFVKKYVAWGAGSARPQYLVLGAKARAITSGRYHVSSTTSGPWRTRCCGTAC